MAGFWFISVVLAGRTPARNFPLRRLGNAASVTKQAPERKLPPASTSALRRSRSQLAISSTWWSKDYRFRKLRSLAIVEWRAKAHLEQLRSLPASKFNAAEVKRYVAARRAAGAEDPTINRELSIIRRGFTSAKQSEPPLVHRVPYIPKLEEDNVRQGFLEPEQYEKVLVELPQRLRAPFVCAYHVGTRKGELRKVQWSQVDFDAGFIHLTARRGGPCPSYGEMLSWLRKQWESRAPGCPWAFRHKGMPIGAQRVGAKPRSAGAAF